MTSLIGQQIAQYTIESVLGESQLGVVYKAQETDTARRVALRVIDEKLTGNPTFQRRFWDMAQTAVSLQHANILPVYEVNFKQSALFMAMSLVEEGNLSQKLQQWRQVEQILALADALNLVAQLADGLTYAHERSVYHRAITPDNIFVRRAPQGTGYLASAMLADFGLAYVLPPNPANLENGPLKLLPYLSPEQVLGEPVDGRSDLYALGVLLYQLVTGHLPYAIETCEEAIHKHLHAFPAAPQHHRPNLPDSVAQVIMKTMAKEPALRFQSGHDLAMALRSASTHLDTRLLTAELNVISLQKRTARGNMPRLYIMHPYETTRIIPLNKQEIVIGRSRNNDIQLTDESISRRHVHILFHEGSLRVIDLNSTNGVFLNETRLPAHQPHTWPSNQNLRIGTYVLHWE